MRASTPDHYPLIFAMASVESRRTMVIKHRVNRYTNNKDLLKYGGVVGQAASYGGKLVESAPTGKMLAAAAAAVIGFGLYAFPRLTSGTMFAIADEVV